MKTSLVCLMLLAVVLGGCTTKSRAKANAQSAYAAGQQQAFANMQEARRTSIRVLGSVRNPLVEWTDGLTLAQAIVAADYTSPRDPSEIVVSRQREQIRINPKDVLRGNDVPLEPGDTIELKP
jgi:protein involved in polysaccharide export with SLBB domain